MLVAQISDTHILAPDPDLPAASLRADCLRRCVADINCQEPDAVLLTGDTVQHGRADEYALLQRLLSPLAAPFFPVPGNRDDKQVLRAAFTERRFLAEGGEFLHYAIDDYDVRLVGIDSTLSGERKGRFCEARQAWLEATLDARPDMPTLLFIHHPPFDVDDHYVGGYRIPGEAAALEAIVRRRPQVVGMLCGHVHWSVSRAWAGTEARIMPSVAVDLRKGIDETEARGRPVYMLHRVSRGKGLVSEARMVEA
ncbi:MAG: metallophosphoesterase [Gammaproteobacteria bacterium]|nr:metallophosphoesterase [Gammaproteobacteria bacterium]NNF49158.1 phosphodiesterase [Woeseiaceae bacterium]NNL62701.1 phosphodiesterase [Woeseiaceae bacterium]